MTTPGAKRDLADINERQALVTTAFDEFNIAGSELQEASSTTLPPNSRFVFVRNGAYLNPDEVDAQVTHTPPLYQLPLTPGDVWVAGGSDRNAYVTGFESAAGIAFETENAPTDDGLLPDDLDLLEAGYGTLFKDTALSGVPNENFVYRRGGFVLHLERNDADLRVYKSGTVAASLPREEWVFDPYTDPDFQWDPSFFTLLRVVFDLYGAGSATFFLRIRDAEGAAHTKELGTLGVRDGPLLDVYNHQVQLRAEATDAIVGSPTVSLGPVEFHNRFQGDAPARSKTSWYRSVDVNDTPSGSTWTVVRVFRIDIERREAGIRFTGLDVDEGATNTNVILRSVHRDFLDFSAGPDPDNEDSWRAPPGSVVRETAIEEYEAASDTVTISTFTDEDGVTKTRGEKELTAVTTSGTGNRQVQRAARGRSTFTEHAYLVLLAQVANVNENIDLITVTTEQRW